MPPKGLPQPTAAERQQSGRVDHTGAGDGPPASGAEERPGPAPHRRAVPEHAARTAAARRRPDRGLPPDAVSKDGFLNNKDTLQLSPLLTESYFEIAEEALNRAIVDPKTKPSIQNFRVDLGAGVNPAPLPEKLILGAGSELLENSDVLVTQLTPTKPFAFEPFFMRTKYRFIEGYRGNDTVRGWRDYDSIYHAVFADMRGSGGYPKGEAYSTVPQGLLLRPAIPNDEIFGRRQHLRAEGEFQDLAARTARRRPLPRDGDGRQVQRRSAARSRRDAPQTSATAHRLARSRRRRGTVTIPKAGIYQVDVYAAGDTRPAARRVASHRGPGRLLALNGDPPAGQSAWQRDVRRLALRQGRVPHRAAPTSSCVPRSDADERGRRRLHRRGMDSSAASFAAPACRLGGTPKRPAGWYLDMPTTAAPAVSDHRPGQRCATATVSSPAGRHSRQRLAACRRAVRDRRGKNETRLYVNGYPGGPRRDRCGAISTIRSSISARPHPGGASLSAASWPRSASTAGRWTKPKFRPGRARQAVRRNVPPASQKPQQT